MRSREIDYLAYALMDAITDHYFSLLDQLGEQLEQVEDKLLDDPNEKTFQKIHRYCFWGVRRKTQPWICKNATFDITVS